LKANSGRAAPADLSPPTRLSFYVGSWSPSSGSSVQKEHPIQPPSSKPCRHSARMEFWRTTASSARESELTSAHTFARRPADSLYRCYHRI
jgi:hypothetical protein